MFRTASYVVAVLSIGTFAIAWSQQGVQQTMYKAETLSPDTFHKGAGRLPLQEVNDMTFIYADEK